MSEQSYTRDVSSRATEALDETRGDWIAAVRKTIGVILVAAIAAWMPTSPEPAKMTETLRPTRSVAHGGQPLELTVRPAVTR